MLKWFKRWRYSRYSYLIPKDRHDFDVWAYNILDAFDLELTRENADLIYSMTFRLDFKIVEIIPKYYFDSIHRLQINQMIHSHAQEMIKEKEQEEKDEAKLSLLKQSPSYDKIVEQKEDVIKKEAVTSKSETK